MKTFKCGCGSQLYFENTLCLSCNKKVAYDFTTDTMNRLSELNSDYYLTDSNKKVKLCKNFSEYNVCNALIPYDSKSDLCISCQLNRTIPNLEFSDNIKKWAKLEKSKRRLVRSLLKLGLPVTSYSQSESGIAFDFIQDQQQNPNVHNEFVTTGHYKGLITINLAEADDIHLENTKSELGEQYRTPLGHLRHESGHYYFDLLIKDTSWLETFREIFGNEQSDYQQALDRYYQSKPHTNWNQNYISEYAMVHPLEDWAECWAHYLHMVDTLESAQNLNILDFDDNNDIDAQLYNWANLSIAMNELNRSMGLNDAYPFILNTDVVKKLCFLDQVIDPNYVPTQQVGVD